MDTGRTLYGWLVLLLLVALIAFGATLGLVQAPPSADLAVSNAAGETLSASGFSVVVTQRIQEGATQPPQTIRVPVTYRAGQPLSKNATVVVGQIEALASSSGWTASGGTYHLTTVHSQLELGRGPTGQLQGVEVHIVSHADLQVTDGYVGTVTERISSSQYTLDQDLRFLTVGGTTIATGPS